MIAENGVQFWSAKKKVAAERKQKKNTFKYTSYISRSTELCVDFPFGSDPFFFFLPRCRATHFVKSWLFIQLSRPIMWVYILFHIFFSSCISRCRSGFHENEVDGKTGDWKKVDIIHLNAKLPKYPCERTQFLFFSRFFFLLFHFFSAVCVTLVFRLNSLCIYTVLATRLIYLKLWTKRMRSEQKKNIHIVYVCFFFP